MDLDGFRDRLLDPLEAHVRDHPGVSVEFLARLARKETRDARVTDDEVEGRIASSPVLIGRPDGGVAHLSHALEGSVLTQRVRSSTARRNDLWTTLALMPYFLLAVDNPLPLASGGELRATAFGHAALVGPDGWLRRLRPGSSSRSRSATGRSTRAPYRSPTSVIWRATSEYAS